MTGRVHLLCGKICCGKTTYANALCARESAVILSADRLMLALFPPYLGDQHEEISAKCRAYLLEEAVTLARAGVTVILDWGFWTRESRREANRYFQERGIPVIWHYLAVSDALWAQRIARRNAQAPADAYPVDDNLKEKCLSLFQQPDPSEIDCWVECKDE